MRIAEGLYEGSAELISKVGGLWGKESISVSTWQTIEKAGQSMTQAQAQNLERFIDKLPQNAENVRVKDFLNDGKVFQADSPATNIPGSFARYEKQIDINGNTVFYTKTTYGPNSEIIHVAPKFPAGPKIYPELELNMQPKYTP